MLAAAAAAARGPLRLVRLGGHNRQGSLLSCGYETVQIPQALTDLSSVAAERGSVDGLPCCWTSVRECQVALPGLHQQLQPPPL